jgi:alcohol dehydrogenase class IV
VLGGSFDLPHSETHTVMLPYAMAFNAEAAPDAMRKIARALDARNAVEGLWQLNRRLNVPVSLAVIGMRADGVARAAGIAVENPYWNPRPLDRMAIQQLLQRAYDGTPPEYAA